MLTPMDAGVRIGLNYTPSRQWYYCWNDWDLDSIREDLHAIAALGADHIRVQLIWPYFQPNPTFVSPGHLRRLGELMSAAEDEGLDVLLAVLTGWLSGYFFLPSRVKGRDVFTKPAVIESEKLLLARVLDAVSDWPNFMGLDLGNEINCLDNALDQPTGDAWARDILAFLRKRGDPGLIVNGIDHGPTVGGVTFSMDHLANEYDAICLHTWPKFTSALTQGELDDAPSLHLSPFFAQLARLFAEDHDPVVWIQEFGACDTWGTTEQQSAFMRSSVELGVRAGASVYTWWCSHDKTRDLKFKEDEYQYGLLTPDNDPKPLAEMFSAVVKDYRGRDATLRQSDFDVTLRVPRDFRPAFNGGEDKELLERQLTTTTWDLYRRYLAEAREGRLPRLAWDG